MVRMKAAKMANRTVDWKGSSSEISKAVHWGVQMVELWVDGTAAWLVGGLVDGWVAWKGWRPVERTVDLSARLWDQMKDA